MAFSGVTYPHGPSPQPTACRPLACSLITATELARPKRRLNLLHTRSLGWMGKQGHLLPFHVLHCCPIHYVGDKTVIVRNVSS